MREEILDGTSVERGLFLVRTGIKVYLFLEPTQVKISANSAVMMPAKMVEMGQGWARISVRKGITNIFSMGDSLLADLTLGWGVIGSFGRFLDSQG